MARDSAPRAVPRPATSVDIEDIFLDATSDLRTGESGLTALICSELALDIVEGRLLPGQEINSVELAARFESSRTPVRESLLRLESEGLIESRPRRRPSVFRPSLEQVRDIYQLRAHLHVFVSELVVERITEPELDELDAWLAVCDEDVARGDSNAYFWHNIAARNTEAFYAGNPELHRVLRSLGLRTLQLRHLSLSQPGRAKASLECHRALNAAYRTRDVALAKQMTVELITAGYAAIEAWLSGEEKRHASAAFEHQERDASGSFESSSPRRHRPSAPGAPLGARRGSFEART